MSSFEQPGDIEISSDEESEQLPPRRSERQQQAQPRSGNVVVEVPPVTEEMRRQYEGLKVVGESVEET